MFEETAIQGVYLTFLREIADHRGSVLHLMRRDDELFKGFGEVYFSEVFPGKYKAWKKHIRQTQNVAVPRGRILLVLFDGRDGSATRGNLLELELGRPDRYLRVTIPPGIWYGFASIGDAPALLVNCVDFPHDPSESIAVDAIDQNINYSWESVIHDS